MSIRIPQSVMSLAYRALAFMLFVTPAWSQGEAQVKDPIPTVAPVEPSASALEKLKGSSRSLNQPEGTAASAKAEKPIVLIYYANEMSADEAERKNVKRMTDALRSVAVAEIGAAADAIDTDLVEFPKNVEKDVAAILQGHAMGAKLLPDVVVFTNAAAREGKCRIARAGEPGKLVEVEFKIPAARSGLYRPFPLSSHEVLRLALQRTAELFPADDHEYVLVTKSHGAPNRAMITRYQDIVTEENRAAFAERAKKQYELQLAAKLKTASPLSLDGKPVADAKGRSLVEKDGVLYLQQVGKLLLITDERNDTYLIDRDGRPFTDKDGKRILVVGKNLKLAGSNGQLQNDQGRPIELLGVLGRNLKNIPEVDQPLANSRMPMLFPLVKSKMFEGAIESKTHISVPVEGGGVVGIPKYRPLGKSPANESTALEWLAHKAAIDRSLAALSVPVLDAAELTSPIIPVGKKISPLLAVDKWIGDANLGANTDTSLGANTDTTLGANTDSTLGANTDTTLGAADDAPLGANTDSTLGASSNGPSGKPDSAAAVGTNNDTNTELATKGDPLKAGGAGNKGLPKKPNVVTAKSDESKPRGTVYGTSKSHYADVLEKQGKSGGMFFRVVFLESCQSQLSGNQLKSLQTKGTSCIGQVWSSDARGLNYSTCDYARAFLALDGRRTFSEAFSQALQAKFAEDEQARAELLR